MLLFPAAYDMVSKNARGAIAPLFNVKAIEAAANAATFEDGLKK